MAQYKGRVKKLFPSRYDGGSFALEEHDRLYFNTKQALPSFVQPGASVEFTGTLQRNGKSVTVDDVSVKEVVGASPSPAASGGGSYGDRDRSIKYQSSRKDALAMVTLLVQAGALPLGKLDSKKAGIVEDAVDKFTAIYFEDIDTLGALERSPPPEDGPSPASAEADKLPE